VLAMPAETGDLGSGFSHFPVNIKQEWVCRTYRRVEKVWSGREMAGDVVERSRSEECDVGMQQRNVCPLAGGTVRLLTVLAMQAKAEEFSHFPGGRSESAALMTTVGDLGHYRLPDRMLASGVFASSRSQLADIPLRGEEGRDGGVQL